MEIDMGNGRQELKWYKLGNKYRSVYFKLVIISLLYVFPIILVNVCYNDDLARAMYGATGWNGDGRPLGELLILLLCGGEPIVDLAPLPLILSVLVLSYALVVYARTYLNFITSEYIQIIILLSVLTNPFAISNLSYRFDCIIMFTALSVPFILFSASDAMSLRKIFVCSVIAGIAVMCLYQPALGMFIILFIVHFFFVVVERRKASTGLDIICGVGAGSLFYKWIIARRFVDSEGWRHEASKIVDFSFQSVKTVVFHLKSYVGYIMDYVAQISLLYQIALGAVIILSIVTVLVMYCRGNRERKLWKYLKIIFLAVSPMAVFGAVFLPLSVLEQCWVRSRILISAGGFLFYVGIMLAYANRKRLYVMLLASICLVGQYIYIYSYGNALKSQNEYEKYMVYSIVHDLETINSRGEYSELTFMGQAPKSRQLQMMCDKSPFFNEVVPVYFGNDVWISGAWVYHYMQYDLTITSENELDREAVNTTEPVIQNSRYACYLNSDKVIVCFR